VRGKLILVAIIAASVGAPVMADAAKPPKPPKPGSTDLSLTAKPTIVTFGGTTRLSGRLRGSDKAGKTIGLEHNRYPFRGFVALRTTKTDSSGNYSFTISPTKHTR
jgi:hypothetical protein